jgi:pyruvate ferredoxin oxidoreductase beta subunit/oxalate oxidoreductase subunit beta
VIKALNYKGPTFLHIHCPCPKGWKFDADKLVQVGKMAIETGMWTLYEWEGGEYSYQREPEEILGVNEYLKLQGRFNHLTDEHIANQQAFIDAKLKAPGIAVELPTAVSEPEM